MCKDDTLSSGSAFLYPLCVCVHLRQGREPVIAFGDVRIVDCTIVLCHFQRCVSQQLLERERITTAVYQVFPRESVPEQMDGGLFYSAMIVIMRDGKAQSIFRQHLSILIAE